MNVTDRQTDRRQTDGRAIAYSERKRICDEVTGKNRSTFDEVTGKSSAASYLTHSGSVILRHPIYENEIYSHRYWSFGFAAEINKEQICIAREKQTLAFHSATLQRSLTSREISRRLTTRPVSGVTY